MVKHKLITASIIGIILFVESISAMAASVKSSVNTRGEIGSVGTGSSTNRVENVKGTESNLSIESLPLSEFSNAGFSFSESRRVMIDGSKQDCTKYSTGVKGNVKYVCKSEKKKELILYCKPEDDTGRCQYLDKMFAQYKHISNKDEPKWIKRAIQSCRTKYKNKDQLESCIAGAKNSDSVMSCNDDTRPVKIKLGDMVESSTALCERVVSFSIISTSSGSSVVDEASENEKNNQHYEKCLEDAKSKSKEYIATRKANAYGCKTARSFCKSDTKGGSGCR